MDLPDDLHHFPLQITFYDTQELYTGMTAVLRFALHFVWEHPWASSNTLERPWPLTMNTYYDHLLWPSYRLHSSITVLSTDACICACASACVSACVCICMCAGACVNACAWISALPSLSTYFCLHLSCPSLVFISTISLCSLFNLFFYNCFHHIHNVRNSTI